MDAPSPLILVIDDDPVILALVRSILAVGDYRVRTVSNGQEALVAVDEERPALVLLDDAGISGKQGRAARYAASPS